MVTLDSSFALPRSEGGLLFLFEISISLDPFRRLGCLDRTILDAPEQEIDQE